MKKFTVDRSLLRIKICGWFGLLLGGVSIIGYVYGLGFSPHRAVYCEFGKYNILINVVFSLALIVSSVYLMKFRYWARRAYIYLMVFNIIANLIAYAIMTNRLALRPIFEWVIPFVTFRILTDFLAIFHAVPAAIFSFSYYWVQIGLSAGPPLICIAYLISPEVKKHFIDGR